MSQYPSGDNGSPPDSDPNTNSDSGLTVKSAPTPTTRALSDRLFWQATYRRYRIARYSNWRTRYRGLGSNTPFTPHPASGLQPICRSCIYYAANSYLVCALHPYPVSSTCPDWHAHSQNNVEKP